MRGKSLVSRDMKRVPLEELDIVELSSILVSSKFAAGDAVSLLYSNLSPPIVSLTLYLFFQRTIIAYHICISNLLSLRYTVLRMYLIAFVPLIFSGILLRH